MVFQSLLNAIPSWTQVIIENETKNIIEKSKCNYLTDLISCVHIIQLKCLTSIHVGNRQKKIDISTPNLGTFIHKVYIQAARIIYKNVYLYEVNVPDLQKQRNRHEISKFVETAIVQTIRDSIPTEEIIRSYLDTSVEEEEEITIEPVTEPVKSESVTGGIQETSLGVFERVPDTPPNTANETKPPESLPSIQNLDDTKIPVVSRLTFSDIDTAVDTQGKSMEVRAPKDIDRLEDLSVSRNLQNQLNNLDK